MAIPVHNKNEWSLPDEMVSTMVISLAADLLSGFRFN